MVKNIKMHTHTNTLKHKKKQCSDLIEVQRGVIAERTDGCQFNQGVVVSAFHTFPILVPEDARAILTCGSLKMMECTVSKRSQLLRRDTLAGHLHFSFRGIGRTGDGEL